MKGRFQVLIIGLICLLWTGCSTTSGKSGGSHDLCVFDEKNDELVIVSQSENYELHVGLYGDKIEEGAYSVTDSDGENLLEGNLTRKDVTQDVKTTLFVDCNDDWIKVSGKAELYGVNSIHKNGETFGFDYEGYLLRVNTLEADLSVSSYRDCNYAVRVDNFTKKPLTVIVDLYEGTENFITNYTIGTVKANTCGIYKFDVDYLIDILESGRNIYIAFFVFDGYADERNNCIYNTELVPFNELKNGYTVCHFAEGSQYVEHTCLNDRNSQISRSTVYDESGDFTEFKLYDDLRWLKGYWVLSKGFGFKRMIFEAGSPYATIDEYSEDRKEYKDMVISWMALNHFGDRFYVSKDKTRMKIVHPSALDENVNIISIYEKR